MVPFLQQLKTSLWLKSSISAILSSLVGIGSFYFASYKLQFSPTSATYVAIASSITMAFIMALISSNASIRVINYLVRAMMIAVGRGDDVNRPDKDELPRASKDYLAHLTDQILLLADSSKVKSIKEEEELKFYQVLSNNVSLPLIVLDREQLILFVNESAIKYLEIPANEIIGKYFYDVANLSFVGDDTLEKWLEGCREGAVIENEQWERVRLNLSDNKRKQFDLSAHYRKDDKTNIETILTLFDRTMQYERDDHDLSFIALAVHELRTPLTIMRGYIEVFQDEISQNLDREQTEFMHNMAASAERLSAFVTNILNVARVEENALVLNLKKEDWSTVLRDSCQDMILRAQVRDKKIVIETEDNLPPVAVDNVSIHEIMNNILDNAIKYTHTRETIVVKSYRKDDFVETTITDKGVGVPSNLIAHVFEKFYRAHSSKNSVGGTGLGLYLCKALVNAHGGNIWVSSKEGKGSTFGFTVPTYDSIADQLNKDDTKGIERSAHGWIKNHSIYRG